MSTFSRLPTKVNPVHRFVTGIRHLSDKSQWIPGFFFTKIGILESRGNTGVKKKSFRFPKIPETRLLLLSRAGMCLFGENTCSIAQKTSLFLTVPQPRQCSLLSRWWNTWLAISRKSCVFYRCQWMQHFGIGAVRRHNSGKAFGGRADGRCGVIVDSNRAEWVYFYCCTIFFWNFRLKDFR